MIARELIRRHKSKDNPSSHFPHFLRPQTSKLSRRLLGKNELSVLPASRNLNSFTNVGVAVAYQPVSYSANKITFTW